MKAIKSTLLIDTLYWKDLLSKNKPVKDNGLLKSLGEIKKLGDEDHDDARKLLDEIVKLSGQLKKSKEAAATPAVTKFLAELASAADTAQKDVAKAKAAADKKGKPDAADAKKKEDATKDGDDVEDEGESNELLTTKMVPLLRDLAKGGHSMHVLLASTGKDVCVLISRRPISPARRKMLADNLGVSGGIKYIVGHCLKEEGMTTFALKTQVAGMAKKLKAALLAQTGMRVKVRCRGEDGETDEDFEADASDGEARSRSDDGSAGQGDSTNASKSLSFDIGAAVGQGGKNLEADVKAVQMAINRRLGTKLEINGLCDSKTIAAIVEFQQGLGQSRPDGRVEPKRGTARALLAPGKLVKPPPLPDAKALPEHLGPRTLDRAPLVWRGARGIVNHNIDAVKKNLQREYANEHPDVIAAIDDGVRKVDVILDKLDTRLSDALERANLVADPAQRKVELASCRGILADYIAFVKSEPLIDHLDNNPFGIKPQIRRTITDSLTHVIRSIA